jgi:1,4-dihydroxy-6-naphthoate synthase
MRLTLCFSPCPNDTFIFDALVHKKVDTEGLEFDVQLEDVETLNRLVLMGKPDISKISYGLLPRVLPDYRVLDAGSALGRGVGPLLVGLSDLQVTDPELENAQIVLPGIHTTAHMLFSLAYPRAQKKMFLPFHEIENAVLNGVADAGVIIHENRFTYAQKGLVKMADLGEIWEENTGQPIPLGGIVMRRDLDPELMRKTDRVVRRSLEYAFQQYPQLPDYVKAHAQEMEEDVMRKHIDLYVNQYSLSLGSEGRAAVWRMLEIGTSLQPAPISGSFEVFI